MKKRIMNKLRSEKGASITFALLLFLVCAVLCSVIIAAATAASGRMSKIAENDQRYYSVMSAAEMMKDMLDKKYVSVVKVKETLYTTVYTNGVKGTPTEGATTTTDYIVYDTKAGDIGDSIEDKYLKTTVAGNIKTLQQAAACNVDMDDYSIAQDTYNLTLTSGLNVQGLNNNALAANISGKLDTNGDITLTIYNAYGSSGTANSSKADGYTVVMVFGADESVTKNTRTETVSDTSDDTTYTVVTKEIETTILMLTWNLSGIKIERLEP